MSFFLLEPKSKSKWQKNLLFLKAYTLLILCHHYNLLFPFHITTINTFTSHHVFLSPSLPLPWTAATSPPAFLQKKLLSLYSFGQSLLTTSSSSPPQSRAYCVHNPFHYYRHYNHYFDWIVWVFVNFSIVIFFFVC